MKPTAIGIETEVHEFYFIKHNPFNDWDNEYYKGYSIKDYRVFPLNINKNRISP